MKYISIIILSFLIMGCVGNTPSPKEVNKRVHNSSDIAIPQHWSKVVDNKKTNSNWIKTFNDPRLEVLVSEALKNNQQITKLQAQVERSQALMKQSAAALKPTIGLGGQYSSRNALGFDEIYGGGITANWEADIWGRLDASLEASRQNLLATQADYRFARQSVVASTAKSWFTLNSTKLQKEYAITTVTLLHKELTIINKKHEIGQVDKRSLHLAKANLAKAQNAASKANVAHENAKRSLEVLLGRYPSALIQSSNKLSSLKQEIPVGIPSELLNRRADIVAAQQRVAAAFYKKREAELLYLPQFNFSIGALLNNLTDAITDLSAGIFAPLYTGGAIEAEIQKATALQKQRIAEYAQTLLTAFKEVEETLLLEEELMKQENYLSTIVSENKKTLSLTKVSFKVGKLEYKEVIQAQNQLISSEISLLDIKTKRLFNRVNLHLALGGNF